MLCLIRYVSYNVNKGADYYSFICIYMAFLFKIPANILKCFNSIQGVESSFGKLANFLASADIRDFGHTCLHVCYVASDRPCTFLFPSLAYHI